MDNGSSLRAGPLLNPNSVSPTGMAGLLDKSSYIASAGSWLHESLPRPFFSRCLKPHPVRVSSVAQPQAPDAITEDSPAPRLNKYSSRVTQPKSQGGSPAILYGVGLSEQDMHKAQVGISSFLYEGNTCNMHLLKLSEAVKEGVEAAGLVGFPFDTVSIRDAISMGIEGMCYSLQSRNSGADSMETVMGGLSYDTDISIPGCDKNMPGIVIAMDRLKRPAILVYGGTIKMRITRWLEAPCKQLKQRLLCPNAIQHDTASIMEVWRKSLSEMRLSNSEYSGVVLSTFAALIILATFTDSAFAQSKGLEVVYGELGADLELGVQVLYLAALLGLIGIASFFVVRQFLFRRELETAAKVLQDRVRTGEALAVEYFELGAIMLRKKFFGLASRYLEQAIEKWDEDPQDLAQVHNALGFSLVNDGKIDKGIAQYEKALKLQPGYVVAWNNLGSAYQKKKDLTKALKAFEQALVFDPNNKVAREYRDSLKPRVERLKGVQLKSD